MTCMTGTSNLKGLSMPIIKCDWDRNWPMLLMDVKDGKMDNIRDEEKDRKVR